MTNLISLFSCHCANTNENSDNGNRKVVSECGVSFKQKSPKIIRKPVRVTHHTVEPIYTKKEIFRLQCVLF